MVVPPSFWALPLAHPLFFRGVAFPSFFRVVVLSLRGWCCFPCSSFWVLLLSPTLLTGGAAFLDLLCVVLSCPSPFVRWSLPSSFWVLLLTGDASPSSPHPPPLGWFHRSLLSNLLHGGAAFSTSSVVLLLFGGGVFYPSFLLVDYN